MAEKATALAKRRASSKRGALLELPTGATKQGWHSIAHLPWCPYAFLLDRIRGVRSLRTCAPDYFSIGILFHAARAQWLYDGYEVSSARTPRWQMAMTAYAEKYEAAEGEKLHPDALPGARKCMEAYVPFWSVRPKPEVLAVEHRVGPRVLVAGHGYPGDVAREARLDAIVQYKSGPNTGTWISEAKTSGTYVGDVVTNYGLHGQVLTQMALWGPDEVKRFGSLRGVSLDVILKPTANRKAQPQEPKFIPVEEVRHALSWFPASVTSWAAQAATVRWADKVERRVGNCGRCTFKSLCLRGKEAAFQFTYCDPETGLRRSMMKWTPSAAAPTPPWE